MRREKAVGSESGLAARIRSAKKGNVERTEEAPAEGNSRSRGRLSLWGIVGLLVLGSAGTSVALNVLSGDAGSFELVSVNVSDSTDFQIDDDDIDLGFLGTDQISLDLTLDNTDAGGAHAAAVTVTAMDAAGNALATSTQATGSVAASGSTTLNIAWDQPGLVTSFAQLYIEVKQTS